MLFLIQMRGAVKIIEVTIAAHAAIFAGLIAALRPPMGGGGTPNNMLCFLGGRPQTQGKGHTQDCSGKHNQV